jgi:hypothetical protein
MLISKHQHQNFTAINRQVLNFITPRNEMLIPHVAKTIQKSAYLRLTLLYRKCGWYVNFARFHDSRIAFAQNIPIIFYFDSINRLLQNYK